MAKDRAGAESPAVVEKEGWLSLQGAQGQGRPVRGVLTDSSFILYAIPKKRGADSLLKVGSMRSTSSLAETAAHGAGPYGQPVSPASESVNSLAGQRTNSAVAFKSVEPPHPGCSDPHNFEAVAHGILFNLEETKSYRAVALTANVLEVTNSMCAYVELLLTKSLAGIGSGSGGFKGYNALSVQIPSRIYKYCQAVLRFPSIVLNRQALTSLLRLASALGSLDAQLAERIKLDVSKAQEAAQKCLQMSLTPKADHPIAPGTTPASPPISTSRWGVELLKLAERGQKLPPALMLEPGFIDEFADQIAAFHRRVWRFWPPTSDLSLLFHIPHGNPSWKLNPLVFDVESPHFLGSLATHHILSPDLSVSIRASLLEKWITVAAKLRELGDSVGWVALLLVIYDPAVLRLSSMWSKVDRSLLARLAHGWGYEAFEVSKRAKIPFLQKKAFRTDTEDMGRKVSKHDFVPYFGDAIVNDSHHADGTGSKNEDDNSEDALMPVKLLGRVEAIIAGWNAYVDSVSDKTPSIHIKEDPAHQCLFAVWAQQEPTTPRVDKAPLSLSIQPKLLGHYLSSFYQQVLPLTSGAMIPVLFTVVVPNFRLFPRSTLILASQPKQSNKPRHVLRRSSSFPPAGPPQTTGISELDSGAREQLENTASAHVLGQVVRDLLNVGTETIDVHSGIVFKSFMNDENNDTRSSRTSSIIESLNKRRSFLGRHVVVKSASMVRLVDVLVLGASIFGNDLILDTETHIATLLATYRSFCSPAEMLDMLLVRVRCARGASRVLGQQLQSSPTYKQIWQVSEDDDQTDAVSVRIISMIIAMLQIWISDYFFDFMNDKFVLEAGSTLLSALRQEISKGNYPEGVVAQCGRVIGSFSRHQFSIQREEHQTPSWLPLVFDKEQQAHYRQTQTVLPELPVTSLEHDGGLAQINTMIDELDSIVADAFSRITMTDWMKLFEVLEQQTVSRLGLFSYGTPPYSAESDVVIQDVYSWLRKLKNPNTKQRVLDVLPEPIVSLVRLNCSLVTYFAAQVADPSLAHPHERRDRMTFILKMLGVLRTRMQFFNLGSDFDDRQGQHIPSFLERAISAAITLPESRAYATSWLAAGSEVARLFPSHGASGGNASAAADAVPPNSRTIFIPTVPTRQGRPLTICIGWIIERLLEIVCCVPNTSVENPELINFDKQRYAYNLIKNMSGEFQAPEPNAASSEVVSKYFFLFGESARTASVSLPLIEKKLHKESLSREGRSRNRVFVEIVSQEIEKIKAETRMYDKIERSLASAGSSSDAQSFYGLPLSQSSTSLYSKRISRLIPSTSTVDVASILETTNIAAGSESLSSGNNSSAAGSMGSGASLQATPSKRLSQHAKKSRFGGLFRAVRPLSVLGVNGSSGSGSSNSTGGNSSSSPTQATNPFYNHQTGSASSLQTNGDEQPVQESVWEHDESIDLDAMVPISDVTPEEWQKVNLIDVEHMCDVQLRSATLMSILRRSGPKPETFVLRATSPQEASAWVEQVSSIMRQKLLQSTRVFGVPLDIVCARERHEVPAFLEALLSQIEERGLDEVGIYRISGSLGAVNAIKQWFDQGNTACKQNDPRWSDINAIAGCIKLYLRELPQPLMTDELFPEFMAVIGPTGVDVEGLREVLKKLPAPNYHVLNRISKHLKLIVDHSAENKMNVQNIAIVFSVNFLPPVAMSQMGSMQQLVSTIVLRREEVFA